MGQLILIAFGTTDTNDLYAKGGQMNVGMNVNAHMKKVLLCVVIQVGR